MDLKSTQQKGSHAWYEKSSQFPWGSEVMDLRRDSTATTLLVQHNPQQYSKS